MKTTNIGCLFAVIIPHSFFPTCPVDRLKALFVGLLLLASSAPLCLAGEHFARTKTLSFVTGKAENKLVGGGDFNTKNTRGFMFDIGSSGEPLRFALDYLSGGAEFTIANQYVQSILIVRVRETALGARYYFEDISPGVDFYAGGGLALVSADLEVTLSGVLGSGTLNLSGSDSGEYFGFGIRRVFDDGLTLGFDYRDSDAEIKIKGGTVKVGAFDFPFPDTKDNYGLTRTSLTLGYSW